MDPAALMTITSVGLFINRSQLSGHASQTERTLAATKLARDAASKTVVSLTSQRSLQSQVADLRSQVNALTANQKTTAKELTACHSFVTYARSHSAPSASSLQWARLNQELITGYGGSPPFPL